MLTAGYLLGCPTRPTHPVRYRTKAVLDEPDTCCGPKGGRRSASGPGVAAAPRVLPDQKVALSRQTVDSTYLPLLESVFMAVQLRCGRAPSCPASPAIPKSYVVDSGIAAHLLRVDERALADPMCAATEVVPLTQAGGRRAPQRGLRRPTRGCRRP